MTIGEIWATAVGSELDIDEGGGPLPPLSVGGRL